MITIAALKQCQDTLEFFAKSEINDPMTDYDQLKTLLDIVEYVDIKRREAWNAEKFSESDRIADEILDDDIPF